MTDATIPEERGYIEELRAALEKATPGEWYIGWDDEHRTIRVDLANVSCRLAVLSGGKEAWGAAHFASANAKLIVLAKNAIPQLLADAKLGQMVREAGAEVVEKVARIIREHHRTHVRQPTRAGEPRKTFHQGDKEAARAVLCTLQEMSDARVE